MNLDTYKAIVNWVKNPSIKNFFRLYKTFSFRFIWLCPLWRIWRIIRNTITGRYKEIASDEKLKRKYEKQFIKEELS